MRVVLRQSTRGMPAITGDERATAAFVRPDAGDVARVVYCTLEAAQNVAKLVSQFSQLVLWFERYRRFLRAPTNLNCSSSCLAGAGSEPSEAASCSTLRIVPMARAREPMVQSHHEKACEVDLGPDKGILQILSAQPDRVLRLTRQAVIRP